MDDAERFKLHFGPYRTPRFRYGQKVFCEVHGEVTVCGVTEGPIPWPVGKKKGRRRSLVVYKGLAKAVRRASGQAVAHWWGVNPHRVSAWRKALGVDPTTEGTRRLRRDYVAEPWWAAARQKGHRAPGRAERIAASMRGKTRPAHVVEAVRKAHLGMHHTAEARAKMSEAHRRRGWVGRGDPVWTAPEDELVRTLPPEEAARRTGRTLSAVYTRRRTLGVAASRQ